jgi:phosphoribosylanthranilate isomerase
MHVRIKICGVADPGDAEAAGRLGADAIGLNFYPASPRYVNLERARAILEVLPPFLEAVGVFANQTVAAAIQQTINPLGMRIQTVQMHGDNPEIAAVFPYRLIPAFSVRDATSLDEIARHLELCRQRHALPAAILIDAHQPGRLGGTGRTLPWKLLSNFEPGVPLILAGGLTADNVAEAVRLVRPFAVDVASGVETAPGRKNQEKIHRFIDAARRAAAGLD